MIIERTKKARAALLSLCFFVATILVQGCDSNPQPVLALEGETMGTYYHVKIVQPQDASSSSPTADELRELTEAALADINNSMSTYIADSELMQFNRSDLNVWVEISEPLYHVLKVSEEVSRLTDGAFDITVAPLVNLWGFGPERSSEPPGEVEVAEVLGQVGYENVELRDNPPRARRTKDVQLDLSAVAKGYGADYLAALYQEKQLHNFMIEIGGELRLAGHNARGKPWRIGVETPSLTHSGVSQAVEVSDVGMATSGDYRNYYEVDGQRFSHTLDPTTGHPIVHQLASVTVIAGSAAEADALATAFNVMGAEKAHALAEARDIAAYFIEHQNEGFVSSYTEAFEAYMP